MFSRIFFFLIATSWTLTVSSAQTTPYPSASSWYTVAEATNDRGKCIPRGKTLKTLYDAVRPEGISYQEFVRVTTLVTGKPANALPACGSDKLLYPTGKVAKPEGQQLTTLWQRVAAEYEENRGRFKVMLGFVGAVMNGTSVAGIDWTLSRVSYDGHSATYAVEGSLRARPTKQTRPVVERDETPEPAVTTEGEEDSTSQERTAELEKQLSEAQSDLQARNKVIASYEDKVAELTEKLARTAAAARTEQGDENALRAQIADLQSNLTAAQAEVKQLQAAETAASQAKAALEEQVEALTNQLNAGSEELQQSLTDANKRGEELAEQLAAARSENAALAKAVRELEENLARSAAQIRELSSVDGADANTAELMGERTRLLMENGLLKQTVKELEGTKAHLLAELEKIRGTVDPLKAKLAATQDENSGLSMKLMVRDRELQEARKALTAAQVQLSAATSTRHSSERLLQIAIGLSVCVVLLMLSLGYLIVSSSRKRRQLKEQLNEEILKKDKEIIDLTGARARLVMENARLKQVAASAQPSGTQEELEVAKERVAELEIALAQVHSKQQSTTETPEGAGDRVTELESDLDEFTVKLEVPEDLQKRGAQKTLRFRKTNPPKGTSQYLQESGLWVQVKGIPSAVNAQKPENVWKSIRRNPTAQESYGIELKQEAVNS